MKDTVESQNHAQKKWRRPAKRKTNWVFVGLAAFFVFACLAAVAHQEKDVLTAPMPRQEGASLDLEIDSGARANIYDRNLKLLAGTYPTTAIYARPLEIIDFRFTAKKIAAILNLNETELLNIFKSERAFVWVGRKISPEDAAKIEEINLPGIYLIEEMNRTYPNMNTAAHALGFVSKNHGLDGVEFYYDSVLRGGIPADRMLPAPLDQNTSKVLQEKGGHLRLTLDLAIQTLLEEQLSAVIKETGARSGTAIAMDPESGAVLAMACLPGFNPNQFWDFSEEDRRNRAIAAAVFPPIPAFSDEENQVVEAEKKEEEQQPAGNGILFPEKVKVAFDGPALPGADPISIDESPFFLAGRHVTVAGNLSVDLPMDPLSTAGNESGQGPSLPMNLSPRSAPPLAVLTAFTSLAGQGRAITPHLLSGILIAEDEKEIANPAGENAEALFPPETSDQIWQNMLANAIPGPSDSLFFEYLDSNDAGEEPKGPALHHRLLLGVAPSDNPRITFLVAVNFAKETAQASTRREPSASPLISMGKKEVGRILKLAATAPQEPGPGFWGQEKSTAKALADGQGPEKIAAKQPAEKPEKSTMPAIAGKSLRHGLQAIQHIEARVKIVGSGLIVDQQPRAGARIQKGDLCVLKLENTL